MRVRTVSVLLSVMLAMPPAAMAAVDERAVIFTAQTTAVVNNPDPEDRLHLRTKPSQDAATKGKYYNGTFVDVLSDDKEGWVRVRIFDAEGYMMTQFLTYPDQLEAGALTVPAVEIKNTSGTGLNLRKAQSTDSASLGFYRNGSTVRVFGVSQDWCHVQTEDGSVGYMLRERLSPAPAYQNAVSSSGAQTSVKTMATVRNPRSIDRLNLRTKPSQDAPTLGKYYSGTTVEVLDSGKDGWTKVRFYGTEGYMMTRFLAFGQEQFQVGTAIPSVKIKNASGTGLNLRKAQSTDSASLGFYRNGSTVRVFGVSQDWCHVQTEDGSVGYMLRERLSPILSFDQESEMTGDRLEGSWFGEPGDPITDGFMPGGNG